MKKTNPLSDPTIDFNTLERLYDAPEWHLNLSEQAIERIKDCHQYLAKKIANSKEPIYGINTGFGSLCNVEINAEDLAQLQTNLVLSHACGVGKTVDKQIVQWMLLLKIRSLAFGYSAVSIETVELLLSFLNHAIYPQVFDSGSLGASGDLVPLAHLCLPLIGKGKVWYKQQWHEPLEVMRLNHLKPITFQAKEGLALLNGTQFMLAYGTVCLVKAGKLLRLADIIAAISMAAYSCNLDPFDKDIHQIRAHKGQKRTAKNIRRLLANYKTQEGKVSVQDPYSFRCIPQVHGASRDAFYHCRKVIMTEINSVTDNPNIFVAKDKILSGGNFHGQPLALALDFLAIAMAEIGSISERRTFRLVSGKRELPEFLVANPGLNSGLMIPQYAAASLVNKNKLLCTPASVDSIESSNGQEDHVSMGANAATKCYDLLNNLTEILAIELLNASQALFFREDHHLSESLNVFLSAYRMQVGFITKDRLLHEDIQQTKAFIASYDLSHFPIKI